MKPTLNKVPFTEEVAAEIRAHMKSMDLKAIKNAKDKNGTFDVIISTDVRDRSGETVKQEGWELANYKNNPIVLWGHDYYSLPIGVCTELETTEYRGQVALRAKGVFLSADINPFAQQVRKLYEFGLGKGEGVGCTTSVGFIPKQRAEDDWSVIIRAELLEFSFVPVPANQGVGASGRAFTTEEAKELGIDTRVFAQKGLTFLETKDVETAADELEEEEEEGATEEDATAETPAAAEPAEEVKDPREPQKALVKSINAEHDRHALELDRTTGTFLKTFPVASEEKPDISEDVRECVKNLRSAISDEHTMHKADTVKCFKGFVPTDEKKAFDINKHLKTVRTENTEYEARTTKALDEFEERCLKAAKDGQSAEDHIDWLTDEIEKTVRAHKKALTHIAKSMAREALGEGEITDEKTLEIVKSAIAPFVKSDNLTPVAIRIAADITINNRKMLGEAYSNLKAATAIVEGLHGALGNDEGDESRSVEDNTSSNPAPRKQRSRPTESQADDDLKNHLLGKEIVREIVTVAQRGLTELNKRPKN